MTTKKEKRKMLQVSCGFSYYSYIFAFKEFGIKLVRKQQIFKLHKFLYANPKWIKHLKNDEYNFRYYLMFVSKYGHQRCYRHVKNIEDFWKDN